MSLRESSGNKMSDPIPSNEFPITHHNGADEPPLALWGPTEGTCSMEIPDMSIRPRTSALRMPSNHPAIRKDNHR